MGANAQTSVPAFTAGQGLTAAQELDRVAEGHTLGFDHPVDRPAAHLAAEAVPEVLHRSNHERGLGIVVERAAPEEVLACLSQPATTATNDREKGGPCAAQRPHLRVSWSPADTTTPRL